MNRRSAGAVAVLGALAYVPPLLTAPGVVAADTKQYLYLDPGRLMATAASLWDPSTYGGWVTHQTIGYLWPLGPWYWTMQHLGVPDWVAQRLWIGTLIFAAATGVLALGRLLGLSRGRGDRRGGALRPVAVPPRLRQPHLDPPRPVGRPRLADDVHRPRRPARRVAVAGAPSPSSW